VWLETSHIEVDAIAGAHEAVDSLVLVNPRGAQRSKSPPEVVDEDAPLAADYDEACLVLADSPKSAAALARRCLQHILHEKAGATQSNLNDQIDHVLAGLPSHLSASVDGVRTVGNFAAHPMKSTNSGELLDVEPGEAEWTLDTVEALMDFFYVAPAQTAAKRAAMNAKLSAAGKPPLK
jgi:hypothetical protein